MVHPESDPLYHTARVREWLDDLVSYLRNSVRDVEEPRAEALFETSAEVLQGLHKAYVHYEEGSEEAWEE